MTPKLPFRKPPKFAGLMSAIDVNGIREKMKGVAMPEPITATAEPVPDTRPECPKAHTLHLCRYWEWSEDVCKKGAWSWRLRTSMFPRPELPDVRREAAELIAKGCRRVEVVTIPGDA